MNHHISISGRQFIYKSEGVRYVAYRDKRGFLTAGAGHRIEPSEQYLMTEVLTNGDIDKLFAKDIAYREYWINTNCNWDKPIEQWEFDMLCDFCYQYNIDEYPETKAAIISGNRINIIEHIMQFRNVVAGDDDDELVPRRNREKLLFETGRYT